MVIKYCFVPSCQNNSNENSIKVFIRVPNSLEIRKKWYEAVYRQEFTEVPKTGAVYCCEDHFDLEEDAKNFMKFKTIGSTLFIKDDVIPHKNIEENSIEPSESQITSSAKKRKSDNVAAFKMKKKLNFEDCGTSQENFTSVDEPVEIRIETEFEECGTSKDAPTVVEKLANTNSIGIQVQVETRTVEVYAKVQHVTKGIQVGDGDVKNSKRSPATSSSTTTATSTDEFSTPGSITSADSLEGAITNQQIKDISCENTIKKIQSNSRFYLGLPETEYFLIQFLSDNAKLSVRNILICLKKIRLNDQYVRIGLDFGISSSTVGNIFTKSLSEIANILQEFIYWPDIFLIKYNLPTQFIARYKNVVSIIDCLEIQIEQPTNAVHQAQTWSAYKKCNTIKYLISATPSGLVTFISEGYGGRATDKQIIEQSNYLEELPNNCTVMADRGFKNIEMLLKTKHCTLVRPPSVKANEKISKYEVLESKRIAALRIHIERVIRRLREFEILKPHACVNKDLVAWLDYIIIIVCGIVNVQGLLIK